MTGDIESRTSWDHNTGTDMFELPRRDALLFVAALTYPGTPVVVELSAGAPARIATDRDRAILRAFLTLALERLDRQEP